MTPTTTTGPLSVPFMDLRPQNDAVRAELEAGFSEILDASAFVGGPHLQAFEEAFAEFVGVQQAIGVASGTDALRIALQAVGVRPGEAVLTVSHSFIATAEAVTQVGATPVFVDIEPRAQTMDPDDLERVMREVCEPGEGDGLVVRETGSRVAAIVPVHLYGQSADMGPILRLADGHGIPVVEDACQAHGATYRFSDGRESSCGAMGRAAAFSFYPGKNLGAMGEAGAVTTADPEIAERVRMLRDHGQSEKYVHRTAEGSNARMDAIQALALRLKLAHLPDWNERRRVLARRYDERIGDAVERVADVGRGRHVYHLYVVKVEDREAVRAALGEADVQSGLHYPIPIHRQEAYEHLGYGPGSLPATEDAAAKVLSLPMYPHMTEEQAEYAADRLVEICRR